MSKAKSLLAAFLLAGSFSNFSNAHNKIESPLKAEPVTVDDLVENIVKHSETKSEVIEDAKLTVYKYKGDNYAIRVYQDQKNGEFASIQLDAVNVPERTFVRIIDFPDNKLGILEPKTDFYIVKKNGRIVFDIDDSVEPRLSEINAQYRNTLLEIYKDSIPEDKL
jgi:hypothetical protein